jgi:aminoglycoside phosphotransferase (APT) family kinase protein
MTTTSAPADALPAIDAALVRALLADQHPDLAHLPVAEFADGLDNRVFRLGPALTVRLPRRPEGAQLIANEHRWLPGLMAGLAGLDDPLATSAPLRQGEPACGYPWRWSVGPWLPGRSAAVEPPADPLDAARRLGAFLAAIHVPAPADAPPNPYRGGPLSTRDAFLELHLAAAGQLGRSLGNGVTAEAVARAWERLSAAPEWSGPPLWLHGDVHPANLVVRDGRLSAVLDFGDLTAGDPATDLFVAWQLLPASARTAFRAAAGSGRYPVDDATWTRAQGWAVAHSVAILGGLPNPDDPLLDVARRTLTELVGSPLA